MKHKKKSGLADRDQRLGKEQNFTKSVFWHLFLTHNATPNSNIKRGKKNNRFLVQHRRSINQFKTYQIYDYLLKRSSSHYKY